MGELVAEELDGEEMAAGALPTGETGLGAAIGVEEGEAAGAAGEEAGAVAAGAVGAVVIAGSDR